MGEKVSKLGRRLQDCRKYDQAPSEPFRSGSGRLGGRGDRAEDTGIEQTAPAASAHPFAKIISENLDIDRAEGFRLAS